MASLPGSTGEQEGVAAEARADGWVMGLLDNGAEFLRPHAEEDAVEELISVAPARTNVESSPDSQELLHKMPEKSTTLHKLQTVHSTGRVSGKRLLGERWTLTQLTQPFNMFLRNQSASSRGVQRGGLLPQTSLGHRRISRGPQRQLSAIGSVIHRLAMDPNDNLMDRYNSPVTDAAQLPSTKSSMNVMSAVSRSRFIIHPLSKLRFYWDWIVILVVLVAAIYIPARVAFQWNRMDEVFLGTNSYRRGANMAGRAIFDTFMLLDVLFNLNCGYIREHDYLTILDRKKILLKYAAGWMLWDVATSTPIYVASFAAGDLETEHTMRIVAFVMAILRLPRALRSINRLSHFSNKVSSFTMRIAEFVALFLLALHWNTCTQFLVAVATGFPDGCWVVELGLEDAMPFTQYTWSLFSAASQMLAIGYGPVNPVLNQELWVVMASFVASTFMFPILISIITTSLISRDTIREEFNRKLEVWNQYMAHRRLPLKLRNRIRSFMTYRWRTHRGVKEDTMLADLPSSLAVEVRLITCQSLIREVPIFRDAPPGFISSLVPHLRLELFLEGEWIIRESTSGREMFFIHSGTVDVMQGNETLQRLERGSYFGEVALMQNVLRSASCRAVTNCEISILHRLHLHEVLDAFPNVRETLDDSAHTTVMRDVARRTSNTRHESIAGLPPSTTPAIRPDESSIMIDEAGVAISTIQSSRGSRCSGSRREVNGSKRRKSFMEVFNSATFDM